MVGGARVCHPVGHGRGGSGRRQAEASSEGLGFHSPDHGVEDRNCCGGGKVNEGPAWCTGKPYWSAAKKACGGNQYGAPLMDGSTEDGQAGCTGKPYWSATKKACGVDQYGAPPMDGSKDG
jgi:hypothetical protein